MPVLVVDDDPAIVSLAKAVLRAQGYRNIVVAGTAADGLGAAPDAELILLDNELPDGRGMDLLPRFLGRHNPPSVVMVTGAGSETLAAAALRAGADDYLVKDGSLREMLPRVVERARRQRALQSARSEVERELIEAERLAAIGEMTVTLHHEINNPLMSALAEVELLLAGGSLTDADRESLRVVQAGLHRIRTIAKQASELRRAPAKPYLQGLRMIDLEGGSDGPIGQLGQAILWIADRDTERLTALLLRHAGFVVERADSARALTADADRPGVSLVVLSTPGGADPVGAFRGFEPADDRGYALVALVAGDTAGALAAGADQAITLPLDPATLAEQLVRTTRERTGF